MARLGRTAAFLRHAAGQSRLPFRPWSVIRRAQTEQLLRTVRFVHERVPFYRDAMRRLGIRPEDVRQVEDLVAWPIVEGTRIQELGNALLPGGRPDGRWLRLRSGGSTGAPKTIYIDPPSLIASMAERERSRILPARAIGRRTGFREAVFAPPEGLYRRLEERMYELVWAPRRARVTRRYVSLFDEPAAFLPELAAFHADHFHGYGSQLGRIFQAILEAGSEFPLPRAVSYSSDEFPEPVRRAVVEQLGVPVYSLYGAVEALNMGFSCGQGDGFHLNVDMYPLRIVDEEGRTLPAGESGSVIVSNLRSRGTMLLNYRIGDRARMLTEPCPCGRILPRLADLEGRDDEWVARAGGQRLHGQAVRTLFTHEDERVWRYRVVQEELNRFRVTVVPARGVERATLAADLVELFRRRFGEQTVVDLTFVAELEQTGAGKVRPFVSRIAEPGR